MPAGDYSVIFNSFSERYVYICQGTRWVAMVPIHAIESARTPGKSELLVVKQRDKALVHILYADELRCELHFSVPQQYEVYTRLMTRVSEPMVIERIRVTVSGK